MKNVLFIAFAVVCYCVVAGSNACTILCDNSVLTVNGDSSQSGHYPYVAL